MPHAERACRTCGCTDRSGCEEGCRWVETDPDLCSVCAGVTPMRRRHYTRCLPDTEPMMLPPYRIHNAAGRHVADAYRISEAQHVARALDLYWRERNRQIDLLRNAHRRASVCGKLRPYVALFAAKGKGG